MASGSRGLSHAITKGRVRRTVKATAIFQPVKTVSVMGITPIWAARKCPGVAMARATELVRPWCQITKPENEEATSRG